MPDSDLLPEIVIDDSADGYVETDDEMEEDELVAVKSRPPASEIFHSQSQQDEPVLEVEMPDEELPEERQPEPAPELSIEPIAKPKRQASAKQREHLARIRVKAAESRRQKTAQRRQQQQRPATARSTPHPTFSDGDVDRLLDRYKERRKAKKAVKTKPDSSALQQSPAQTINADLHTVAPVDDPWAECFL